MARATVTVSYHFDAVSTWLWSFDSWEKPARHARGIFGAHTGAPRLLDLHDELDVPSTWCIPGHTIESFPDICGEVWDRGHGVQHHGWAHKAPSTFEDREAEKADIERGIEAIRDLTGRKPTGYSQWSYSRHTHDLLEELGFEWDSSMMQSEFRPHYVYTNWKAPRDGPYDKGEPTDIVELPVSWERDDFPPFTYTWSNPHRMGYHAEDVIFQKWYDQFDWMYDNVEDGVFVLTLHPQIIGQAHRIGRLEDFFEYVLSKPGVEFEKMEDAAADWRESN